jgi:hypothetical protein
MDPLEIVPTTGTRFSKASATYVINAVSINSKGKMMSAESREVRFAAIIAACP